MHENIKQAAPLKRRHYKRLTAALKALPIDPEAGVKLDFHTARCLRSYAKYHGWEIVQLKEGESIVIWRIG